MIRKLDLVFSFVGLIIISPILVVIAILIKITSTGPVFYRQQRVGLHAKDFGLYKFRTMKTGSDKAGLLTVGGRDSRITNVGFYLRKFKLDELPQLINVLKGDMSLVGPRPEVRKYVNFYNQEQLKILAVLPGITDYASIAYRNENDILALSQNPEELYINEIMPRKIELNATFIANRNVREYFYIIFKTVFTSLRGR